LEIPECPESGWILLLHIWDLNQKSGIVSLPWRSCQLLLCEIHDFPTV
jgi:hypothetical protein